MRIVTLNGQNHKGITYHIGRMVADKIQGENEITEFFFPRDLNHFCAGCYRCIEDISACPYYDEKKVILEAIDEADVLIVTTPTYCLHVSAPLKSFLDMTFDSWMSHRPMESMFKKRAVIISSSAGSTTKSALKDVEDALFYMGVPEIIKYGKALHAMNWEEVSPKDKVKVDEKTTKIASKLGKDSRPRVGIKTRFIFNMMRMLQKKGWNSSPVETVYWQERGWLEKSRPWKKNNSD